MEPDDERLARLQRSAYGSGATDAEREAAQRELRALHAAPPPADASTPESTAERAGTPAGEPSGEASDADEPTRRRLRGRTAIIASAAALVVGVLVGWQVAVWTAPPRASSATPPDGPRTQAEYQASLPVALDTVAAEVFDRPAGAEDAPPTALSFGTSEGGGVQPEFRLLATRSDGVTVYGVRVDVDLCLYAVLPEGLDASGATGLGSCTNDGRFPEAGLHMGAGASGVRGLQFTWTHDGALTFDVARG